MFRQLANLLVNTSWEHAEAKLASTDAWKPVVGKEIVADLEGCLDRLSPIPSAFDQLLCLARIQRLLTRRHQAVLTEWMCYTLDQRCKNLERSAYAAGRSGMFRDRWLPRECSSLIPPEATKAEKDVYLATLQLAIEIVSGRLLDGSPKSGTLDDAHCNKAVNEPSA